jgi:preprotein translocase subunit SecA
VIFRTGKEKYNAIVDEIERMHKWDLVALDGGDQRLGTIVREGDDGTEFQPKGSKETEVLPKPKIRRVERRGRPMLVGTISIERSELLSEMLNRRGIPHQVLNAKHHQREAEIVAQAGRKNAVTIATNMAGRGTDIILGGNPEAMAWAALQEKYPTRLDVPQSEWDALVNEIEKREQMKAEGRDVAEMGGLHILGTERHEARRIDLQLRGRCGRQGDPGSSRFYLSLEDDLMRIFAGEWVKNVLTRLGMQDGEAIESRLVSRRIEGAQKKVEERHFETRKSLLEYDEVMDEQRKRVYSYRQSVLDGTSCKKLVMQMIDEQIADHLQQFLDKDYGTESFAKWASDRLGVELESRDFRGMDFETAQNHAKDEAERKAESQVRDALEENVPEELEESEWNWEALAKTTNTRWGLSVRDRDLKRIGRQEIAEFLIARAREAALKIDLGEGRQFLDPEFGVRTACAWVRHKFGIELAREEVIDLDSPSFQELVRHRAEAAYHQKEIQYPVMAGLLHFTTRDAMGHKRYDREKLAEWAHHRFQVELSIDDLRNRQRDEIHDLLVDHSARYAAPTDEAQAEAESRLEQIFNPETTETQALRAARDNGRLQELCDWLQQSMHATLSADDMLHMDRQELADAVSMAVEDHYRPEMRKMERALLLQLLDLAWKDHLLVMDHLRSSVGLRGYAQVDPKVEYKREGMRTFEQMWKSVGERVTDLIFRMEQIDEGFIGSTWSEAQAIHEELPPASDIGQQQEDAIEGTQSDHKPEPIRNRQERVGRNDPCPCGSGKKFKNCHMRKGPAGAR